MDWTALHKIFEKAYHHSDWVQVLQTVFGAKQLYAEPRSILLPGNDKATAAFELGSFVTAEDRIVGLYRIDVRPNVWLERNKVSLRELLRNVYQYDVDGAIVVFVQDDKWRLSFISEIKVLNDVGELTKQETEPKRYTYLLGEGQKVKTPADRLSKLAGKPLSLKDIQSAFSVEALNEEFYKIVQSYFYKLVGGQVGKGKKLADYGEGILQLPSPDRSHRQEFAVRLIGRTVFSWFLKMKKSDSEIALLPESLLSSEAVGRNNNYYHTILERLFFQTLNTPMDERLEGLPDGAQEVPFLNGGLFEPNADDFYNPSANGINQNNFELSDEWFLNFFRDLEKYNFTIDENSVTEIEVSVDPEMLGRIFENLLAEIDPESGDTARKATGSFYTPREIVDFMAVESLVLYLHNETSLDQERLRPLFKMLEGQDPQFSQEEGGRILEALDKVKILDPACGSGAFPMGVLQKIVQALQKLDPKAEWWKARQIDRISNPIVKKQLSEKLADSGVEYARKIGIIQNSLYGADIQPVAAEISKLRCFLSLVVDENIDDKKPNRGIEPLPNLEFKFVTADSLIKLPGKDQRTIFDNFEEIQMLEKLREEYIQSYGPRKAEVKERFTKVQQKMAADQNKESGNKDSKAYKIGSWKPFGHSQADWFDPKWMFGVEKFDIVIGNPPYIQLQKGDGRLGKLYEKCKFQTFASTGDLYLLFYERAWELLKRKGALCFITSNKWMRAGYGEKLRKFLTEKTNPVLLVDFAGQKIFQAATVDTNILLAANDTNAGRTKACAVTAKSRTNLSDYIRQNSTTCSFKGADSWLILSDIESSIKRKIEAAGTPLKEWDIQIYRGVLTGYNDAFIIDGKTKDELIKADPKSAEIIRPILRGRDIKRYDYQFADKYLIATFPSRQLNIDHYPAVKQHLLNYGYDRLKQTGEPGARKKTGHKWFETQDSISYWEEFSKQKIVYPNMTKYLPFFLDNHAFFQNDKSFFITGARLNFLTGFLNSRLFRYCYSDNFPELLGGTRELRKVFFEKLRIPSVSEDQEIEFKYLVEKVQNEKSSIQRTELCNLIDHKILELYHLTKEEKDIINKNILF